MRQAQYRDEVSALLREGRILKVSDFMAVCSWMPQASVYTRIRNLVASGALSMVGRGCYVAVRKPEYPVVITEWMKEVNDYLIVECEGVCHCISLQGENLLVEVGKQHLDVVERCLKGKYSRVVRRKDAERFPAELDGFIIIGQLISEAPLMTVEGCSVSSLEKTLVDSLCGKEEAHLFQRAMEVYPVNVNRLRRYAARRGLAEELRMKLASLDERRIGMISEIQRYLSGVAVSRAWLFGSFSRFEETPESDIDLLVDYCPEANLSLIDIMWIRLDLEKMTGRSVDLVQNGTLRPFAAPSAEKDKYLIYER